MAEPQTWYTALTVVDDWPDAISIDEAKLDMFCEAAKIQVMTFAKGLAAGVPIPATYRLAHLMQIRNLWNATKVGPDGDMGGDDFVIRPFPLDWQVKALLRPRQGVPVAL